MKNPYEILGVKSDATQDEIKNAYRKLAKKLHPDLNPGNKEAEKRFKDVSSAYDLVGTPEARAKFDRGETEEQMQGGAGPFGGRRGPFYHQTQQGGGRYSQGFGGIDEDILSSIFGQMGGAGGGGFGAHGPAHGQDALYQMDIDFTDAARGAEKEISLPNGKKLRVKIPAGVESGTRLRFSGQGESPDPRIPPGDAYVQLNVRPSEVFKRHGKDIEVQLPISLSEAVLGGQVRVPTLDGAVMLNVPSGVSSGQRLRIPRKGIGATDRGDQYVVLKVVLPKQFDPEFKDAVAAWAKRQPFDPRGRERASSAGFREEAV